MNRIVVCGDVDSGKSTLIGKIILDKKLFQFSVDKLYKYTDTFSKELEQSKTIRASRYYIDENNIVINCPGHIEYIKSIISCLSNGTHAIIIENHETEDSANTALYEELVKLFNLNYIKVFNSINCNMPSKSHANFDIITDVANVNSSVVLKLLLQKNNAKHIPIMGISNNIKTVLVDDFTEAYMPGGELLVDIQIPRTNELIQVSKISECRNIGDKIVFYKNK
ncbi:MAG: GTP-binding protein, partial [Anaeroplasmataceae bacterium]